MQRKARAQPPSTAGQGGPNCRAQRGGDTRQARPPLPNLRTAPPPTRAPLLEARGRRPTGRAAMPPPRVPPPRRSGSALAARHREGSPSPRRWPGRPPLRPRSAGGSGPEGGGGSAAGERRTPHPPASRGAATGAPRPPRDTTDSLRGGWRADGGRAPRHNGTAEPCPQSHARPPLCHWHGARSTLHDTHPADGGWRHHLFRRRCCRRRNHDTRGGGGDATEVRRRPQQRRWGRRAPANAPTARRRRWRAARRRAAAQRPRGRRPRCRQWQAPSPRARCPAANRAAPPGRPDRATGGSCWAQPPPAVRMA